MTTIIWAVSIIYLLVMLWIGFRVFKEGSASFDDYAIADKKLPLFC